MGMRAVSLPGKIDRKVFTFDANSKGGDRNRQVRKKSLLKPINYSRQSRSTSLPGKNGSSRHVRSGQFYSIIAVIISIPIILFISGTLVSVQKGRSGVADKIVGDQLHLTERSMEDDFVRGSQIPSKRAVLAMTNVVTTNGTYFADSMAVFREASLNGTIMGVPAFLMYNNTLNDWRLRVLNVSTGFLSDMNFSVNITGFDRDLIIGNFSLNITVREEFGRSWINRSVNRNYSFSIAGFEDPFFAIKSGGKVRRSYQMYGLPAFALRFQGTQGIGNFTGNATFSGPADPSKVFVTDNIGGESGWGCVVGNFGVPEPGQCYVIGIQDPVSSLDGAINSLGNYRTIYVDDTTKSAWLLPVSDGVRDGLYFTLEGPNVFERLQGRFSSSFPQFVTFVDTERFSVEGIPVAEGISRVDWIYFGGFGIPGRQVRSLPEWFRVDDIYAQRLNLTDLLIG